MSNKRWCVNIQQQDALRLDSRNDSGENLKIGPVMLRSGMRAIWKTVASRASCTLPNTWPTDEPSVTHKQHTKCPSLILLLTRNETGKFITQPEMLELFRLVYIIPTTRKILFDFSSTWRICINQSILKLIISLYYLGDGSVLLGLCWNKSHQRTRRMFDRLLLSFGWLLLLLLLLLRAQLGVKILVGISGA